MATIGETSTNSPPPPQSKPVVVRVKRKAHQSRLDAFWLEINERPTKKAMLDLENLSISNNSVDVKVEELIAKKVFVKHVETVTSLDTTVEIVQSFASNSAYAVEEQKRDIKKYSKQEQILSRSRQNQEVLASNARFEQIWRSRRGDEGASEDKALHDMCNFYDVVLVGESFELNEGAVGNEEGIVNPGTSGLNVCDTGTEEACDTGTEEAATDQSNLVLEEWGIGSEGVQFAVETEADMDLVDSPVRKVNIEVVDAVIVSKNPNISSLSGIVEDCFLDTQNNSLVHQDKLDGSHISGVKRKKMTYDEQKPSVHVMYNSLTRASKQKLEELLQQWSEWHAQQNSSHDSDEMLQSGEDSYFPALRIGMEKSSSVSFWIENQARKQQDNDLIILQSDSVPLYDRGYVLGLTSADDPINVEGGLEIVDDAARCFNCGSYNHSLKECPKPRDNAAVNNARKQHKFKRNQNSSSRNPTRYYQSSSGGKYDGLKPGSLDTETQQLLGLGDLDPPPWFNRMRELGYPPGYLDPDDEDQPSGITIFADGDVEEEPEDGEIMETDHPEPLRKMSVEFPGINAPIPENADQRLWEVGPSSYDSFRHRSHRRSNHSSEATGRWHHHEQRQYRDFINDGPPGVDSAFSPSMSSYPPRYGHHDSSYSSESPRDLTPAFGRSNSGSALVNEDFVSQGSSSYSSSRKRSSPQNIGSARYETDNSSRDDYDMDYSYRDYSFRSEYRHHSRR